MSDLSNPPPDGPLVESSPQAPESGPGSARGVPGWLWVLSGLLLAAVIVLQRPGGADPAEAKAAQEARQLEPVGTSPLVLMGKVVLGFGNADPQMATILRQQLSKKTALFPPTATDKLRTVMLLTASGATDEGTGTMMFGRSEPLPSAGEALRDIRESVAADSPIRPDIDLMDGLLAAAEKDRLAGDLKDLPALRTALDGLSPEQLAGLTQRHGWYAEMLLAAGKPEAPVRQTATLHASLFIVLVATVGVVLFMAFVGGLVLLILGFVKWTSGRASFREPEVVANEGDLVRRRVWMETFAVFVGGFLALKLVTLLPGLVMTDEAIAANAKALTMGSLLLQWLLLPLIFWPLARGLSKSEWRRQIGWRVPVGSSVVREVGSGLAAYVASVPIYLAMAVVVVILMFVMQLVQEQVFHQEPERPATPRIAEVLGSGGAVVAVVVFLLATVWAPVVEESIFRGALFRGLRSRWGFLVTAFITASFFAAMHGYMLVQLLMVFTLGAVFAFMREWRGSLIPSVTAHALHNGMVMSLMVVAGYFMTP